MARRSVGLDTPIDRTVVAVDASSVCQAGYEANG